MTDSSQRPAAERKAFHPTVPLHHQIGRLLRARILSQEWAPGEKIPTEVELADTFGVSRTTIRQAIHPLVQDNLLVRHRAKGTYVPTNSVLETRDRLVFANQLLGYQANSRLVHAETASASTRVADVLQIERFAAVRRFVRVETVDDEPVAVVINFVKPKFAKRIRKRDLQRRSMIECLRSRAGVRIGRVHISASAVMPDEEIAGLLHSDLTYPVLLVLVVAENDENVPVQAAYGYYRSDRVRFEQTLDGAELGAGSVFDTTHGGQLMVSQAPT